MSAELQLNEPETLYQRWEDSQWSPYAVDLVADQEQWRTLSDDQRELIYFVLASLMVAEERITTKFSGLIAAGSPHRSPGTSSAPANRYQTNSAKSSTSPSSKHTSSFSQLPATSAPKSASSRSTTRSSRPRSD
jgi:hypothetical protein